MVKNCIVGKKTAIIKIPPSRSAESTFKKPPAHHYWNENAKFYDKIIFYKTFLAFEQHKLSKRNKQYLQLTGFDYYYTGNLQIAYNHKKTFPRDKFCLFLTTILEGIKISQNNYSENSIINSIYAYVSFSSQNISNFMGSKTLEIHRYYWISQEQSTSTVILHSLILNERVGYR